MEGERPSDWLTYREAGERVGCTAEIIRLRALRGKWPKRRGNDGRARIQLPEDARDVRTPNARPVRTPDARDVQTASEVAYDTAYAAGLAAERAKVEAERVKAERVIAEFATRDTQHAADLAGERARTEKAIAAFASLADRLDALAAARSRPWWRRLVG